jgi:uncharacterized protein YbaA (DUF1428 family)
MNLNALASLTPFTDLAPIVRKIFQDFSTANSETIFHLQIFEITIILDINDFFNLKGDESMAQYVDGIVIPVPKKNMKAYTKMAKASAKAWKKCGALKYVESVADDVAKGKVTSFPRSVKLKGGETVVFIYAVYKSRAHRDRVMAKVMKDKKLMAMWEEMPFDGMRMIWGGFKTMVSM